MVRQLSWLLSLVFVCSCGSGPAPRPRTWEALLTRRPAPRPLPQTPAPPGFLHERLENGLRVSILPDPRSPVVATQIFYHVGAAHEDARSAGFAHLFEHLMFGATRGATEREYDDLIHRHGGYANAYTAADETVYISEITPAQHPQVLQLEAKRMTDLLLTQEGLDRERRIVIEEQRLRFENNPALRIGVKALRMLLTTHPYNRIGTDATLANVTLEEARRFYARYYRPQNAHLIIVGPVDGPATMALVRGAFGAIPAGSGQPPMDPPTLSEWRFPRDLTLSQDLLPGKGAALLFPLPPADHPDSWALQVLQQILTRGRHNPLSDDLVRERGVAVQAGVVSQMLRRGGGLVLYAGYLPYRSKAAALRYLEEAREHLASMDWLTERSLQAAKRALRKAQEGQGLLAEQQAARLGVALHHHGDVRVAFERGARLEAVTLEEARAAFARYVLAPDPIRLYATPEHVPAWLRLFGWLYPLVMPAQHRAVLPPPPPSAAVVARPPDPSAEPAAAPAVITFAVDAGTTALLLRDPRSRLVDVRIELPAGRWSPWFRRRHVDDAFSIQLHDGAGALPRRSDELAAGLSVHVSDEYSQLRVSCLKEDLPATLALVRDVLRNRDFDRAVLRRWRLSGSSVFAAQQKDPLFRQKQEALRRLHRRDDPRRLLVEEPDAVETRVARLWAARDELLRLPGRTIGVTGDVSQEELAPLLQGLLPAVAPPPPGLAPVLNPLTPVPGEVTTRMKPLNQVYLALLRPSLGLRHPDYPAFLLVDHVLGGHFRSRLYQSLRHDGGETYSPRTQETEDVVPGAYLVQTYTRAENGARVEAKLRRVVAELHQGGLSEAERADAAAYLLGHLAFRGRTPGARLSEALFERRHGLPPGFSEALTRRAAALPLASLNAFIRDYFDPSRFALVRVAPK